MIYVILDLVILIHGAKYEYKINGDFFFLDLDRAVC